MFFLTWIGVCVSAISVILFIVCLLIIADDWGMARREPTLPPAMDRAMKMLATLVGLSIFGYLFLMITFHITKGVMGV